MSEIEQRKYIRYDIPETLKLEIKVDFGDGILKTVKLKNISAGGIGIHVIAPQRPDFNVVTPVLIHFYQNENELVETVDDLNLESLEMNSSDQTENPKHLFLSINGQVRWSDYKIDQDITVMGINFIHLSADEKKIVKQVIKKCMESMS